jgi:hypothetical protein
MLAAAVASGATAAGKTQVLARQGQMILYGDPNYNGDTYKLDKDGVAIQTDWNVRSIAIYPGEKWQICNRVRFQGACLTITESVPDASKIGVMGQVPSARRIVDKP